MGFSGGTAAFSEAVEEAPVRPQPPFSEIYPLQGPDYLLASKEVGFDLIVNTSLVRESLEGIVSHHS